MKYLLCFLPFAAAVALAQTAPAPKPLAVRPFKGANLITVATADSLRVAVAKVKQILLTQGYELDTVAPDRLTTKGRRFEALLGGGAAQPTPTVHVFRVQARPAGPGTRLAFTGEYSQDLGPKYHFTFPMRWLAPQNPSANQDCFLRAEKLAKAYPKAAISYAQQP